MQDSLWTSGNFRISRALKCSDELSRRLMLQINLIAAIYARYKWRVCSTLGAGLTGNHQMKLIPTCMVDTTAALFVPFSQI